MNKHLLAFLFLTVTVASSLWAQPLAEQVPGDAILYVGWRGVDDLGEGYEGSNLQALRDETDLSSALSQTLDLIEQANPGDEDAAMVVGLIRTIGQVSWRQTTAAYLQPTHDPDMPVRFVVLWEAAGVSGDALEAQLNQMVAQVPDNGFPGSPRTELVVQRAEGRVSLTIGPSVALDEVEAEAAVAGEAGGAGGSGGPGATLAENSDFKRTLTQVDPDGVLVVYADGQGLVSLIDKGVQREGDANELEMWPKIRDALGLAGLNSAVWSAGFDGKDWRSDMFVDAPAPRTGLLSLLDGEPITDQELESVPAEATWMLATRFDLSVLLDNVREAVNEIDPEMSPKLEDALAQGNAITGIDIEADLIRSLGSAWLVYTDPGATGSGILGLCVVNPLKDAEKAEQALTALQSIANRLMGQAGAPEMHIRFHTTTDGGMTLNSLGIPFVSPTWSVHDGKLYLGLYPQTVLNAGDRARAGAASGGSGGGSILTNEKFQAVRARLGGGEASAVVFSDLPITAEDSYQNLVMMSQMGSGMLAMFGADSMPMLLPPYARIEPYLAPAGQVAWSDDTGYHSRSISPFPGSMMLGPQGGTNATMSAPMLVGIMLPALGAARRSARQVHSMSNARQLLIAMIAYSVDGDDTFPEDIVTPLEMGYLDNPSTYLSKASGKRLPPMFNALSKAEQAQWLRQNASYILIPTHKWSELKNPSETICLFELPQDASNQERLAIGFADGHVQAMPVWEAEARILDQTGKTLEELIERQQNYQPPVKQQGAPAAP